MDESIRMKLMRGNQIIKKVISTIIPSSGCNT